MDYRAKLGHSGKIRTLYIFYTFLLFLLVSVSISPLIILYFFIKKNIICRGEE